MNNRGNLHKTLKWHSKVPLYKQLYFELKRKIIDQEFKSGEKFFSEKELIKRYGVSRVTVRTALQMLENEGYIQKRQGSVAVVTGQDQFIWNLDDITHDLQSYREYLVTKVRSIHRVPPTKTIRKNLQLDPFTDFVFCIERIRKIMNIKMARSISYLIPTLPLDINNIDKDWDYSITGLLRKLGKNPLYCEETIEAAIADKETCKLLDLPKNSAVFFRKRITYDDNDIPLEYVESFYNSRYTKYYVKNKLL